MDRDGSEIAAEGLRRITELCAFEKDIRGCAPGQRLSARQARSAPFVAVFGEWLEAQRLRVSAMSLLGEKLDYIHNHWDGLQTFRTDGRVEIDSNNVENLVRPIALKRKNALFTEHDEGGSTLERIASLNEICKINSVEPFPEDVNGLGGCLEEGVCSSHLIPKRSRRQWPPMCRHARSRSRSVTFGPAENRRTSCTCR